MAIVDGGTWGVTIQHIENDRKRPVKRTTLMWAGTDWGFVGDGIQRGSIRRRAVVGPLVENTGRPPFYCLTLDELLIYRVEGGAAFGRETEPSEVLYEDASRGVEAGRDTALDKALAHCASGCRADGLTTPETASAPPAGRKRLSNFGLANWVVALAFRDSRGSSSNGRTASLVAIQANLADALSGSDSGKRSEPFDLVLGHGIALDGGTFSKNADRLRSLIGDLPVVTPSVQRHRVQALDSAFERAGLRSMVTNARLSVDVSGLGGGDITREAEDILAAAGARKRLESGWLLPRRPLV